MDAPQKQRIKQAIRGLIQEAHGTAVLKGFHEEPRPFAETIALMHSELSEALEADRHGNPPDQHLPQYESVTVELADLIIRVFDTAGAMNLPLAEALIAKMKYNRTRPHRNGKQY